MLNTENKKNVKKAIVTGSSSGIGLGVAELMAQRGYDVMLNGIEPIEKMSAVIESFRSKHGINAHYFQANLTNPSEIILLYQEAKKNFGRIDIIVNNAGIQHVSPVESFPTEKWDAIIALNLTAAFHLTKAAIPDMVSQGFGRIINLASTHGLVASPYKSAYVSAKHGLIGLTKCIALEVATKNITVNAVCPGYVLTPLVEKQIPETAIARKITEEEVINDVILAAQPTKKFVTTEQVAELIYFLCSDAASSITGSAMTVDGGWTAQ